MITIANKDDPEEQYLFEQLQYLSLQYERAAKPYIDRLAEIRATQSSIKMVISLEDARLNGFIE